MGQGEPTWVRSSFCNGAGACVEVARLADGGISLRSSRDLSVPTNVFTLVEWEAFIEGVKNGEFDHIARSQ